MLQNLLSERAVLAGIVMNEKIREEYLIQLKADLFTTTAHKKIFNFLFDSFIKKEQISDDILMSAMPENLQSDAEKVLLQQAPTEKTIKIHIKNIKKSFSRRQLLAKLEIAKESILKGESVDIKKYFEDVDSDIDETNIPSLEDIIDSFEKQLEEKQDNPVKTDIPALDAKITLSKGDFIVIGARPSMGKTGFMNTIALNLAKTKKHGAAILSLEMPSEKIVARLLANVGNIPMQELNKGLISDYNKYIAAKKELKALSSNLMILDHISEVEQIINAIHFIRSTNPTITDFFIDHLGHVKTNKRFNSEHLKINYITKELKELAKSTGIRIWLLSQLNRSVEERTNRRPMLSDLRESGSIEEVADIVLGLYRDSYYKVKEGKIEFEPDPNDLEIIILKQRDGETSNVKTTFSGKYMKIGMPVAQEVSLNSIPVIEENDQIEMEVIL